GTLYGGKAGDNKNSYTVIVVRNVADQVNPALPGHLEIGNNEIDFDRFEYCQPILYIVGGIHLVTGALQVTLDQFNGFLRIIYNKYAMLFRFPAHCVFDILPRHRSCIYTSKRELLSSTLVTLIRTTWSETMPSTIYKPSSLPCPTGFVVKKSSKIFSFTSYGIPTPLSFTVSVT